MKTWPEKNLMMMTGEVKKLQLPTCEVYLDCTRDADNFDYFAQIGPDLCHMASSPNGYFDWIILSKTLTSSKWRLNCYLGANGFGEQISSLNTGKCTLIT